MPKTEQIQKAYLFKDLTQSELNKVMELGTEKIFNKSALLFKEGDEGAQFYIIIEGVITVNKNVAGGRKRNISNLSTGEVLGDLALYDQQPRSADAEAVSEVVVMEFNNQSFLEFLESNQKISIKIQRRLIKTLCKRLRDTDDLLKEGVIWGFSMDF